MQMPLRAKHGADHKTKQLSVHVHFSASYLAITIHANVSSLKTSTAVQTTK